MSRHIGRDTIARIQSMGFDVYQQPGVGGASYLFFTDGTRIGYLESGIGGYRLSTVHQPSQVVGTGFQIARDVADFDKPMLESCFISAPGWSLFDLKHVHKYRDMAAMMAHGWHAGLVKAPLA